MKKPVNLGFLDFSSLEQRRHFCEEEVRLNRRLAPAVFRGVVPVVQSGPSIRLEGSGPAVEWAVKMERLPDEATLRARLERGEVEPGLVETLARRVARFHADAEGGPHIAAFGRYEVVAGNAWENFAQAEPLVGTTLSRPVWDRFKVLTGEALARLRPLIEARAERRVPPDTHGDLHLEHVYLLPGRQPPADLVIIDCIEFNERFRYADPIADAAFLVMDFRFHGRPDLARVFSQAYVTAAGDADGAALLPFYTAYRAAVRGKVEGFELSEQEVPAPERAAALARARAHWLLALGELEVPGRRPCLVLVAGLPGSGKSTLARHLAERAGFTVVRSDAVRKELAGMSNTAPAATPFAEGIYTPAWTERTYAECRRRAEGLLFDGHRVLVDASFREDGRRQAFLEMADRLGVPGVFFWCRADPNTVRARLGHRRGDLSDADWSVYLQAARQWEEPGPRTRKALGAIDTTGDPEHVLSQALNALAERHLHGEG